MLRISNRSMEQQHTILTMDPMILLAPTSTKINLLCSTLLGRTMSSQTNKFIREDTFQSTMHGDRILFSLRATSKRLIMGFQLEAMVSLFQGYPQAMTTLHSRPSKVTLSPRHRTIRPCLTATSLCTMAQAMACQGLKNTIGPTSRARRFLHKHYRAIPTLTDYPCKTRLM